MFYIGLKMPQNMRKKEGEAHKNLILEFYFSNFVTSKSTKKFPLKCAPTARTLIDKSIVVQKSDIKNNALNFTQVIYIEYFIINFFIFLIFLNDLNYKYLFSRPFNNRQRLLGHYTKCVEKVFGKSERSPVLSSKLNKI
jgi:hypothetical protein